VGRDSNWRPLGEFYVNKSDIHRYRDKTTEMAGYDNRKVTSGCHSKTLRHQRALLWEGGGRMRGGNNDLFCGSFDYLTLNGERSDA